MAKMNPTSLYITTNQIVLKSDPNDSTTWQDLYRLTPYLRFSLCCVVCGNLLLDPQTPANVKCQHHVCKHCRGGRKKIKPACLICKDCEIYNENKTLRTLVQCYKKMCIMLLNSNIFRLLMQQSQSTSATGVELGAGNLVALIKEGAAFQDNYQLNGGLSKAAYSILPCIYTNSSTQTLQATQPDKLPPNPNVQNVPNGNPMYSVMYAGSGNKITIKRKPREGNEIKIPTKPPLVKKSNPKKLPPPKLQKVRKGCRCGNATAHPGKLTCCGQRCPCYVESKACIDCKCRGCRNPHRANGQKVTHMSMFDAMAVGYGFQKPTHIESKFAIEQYDNRLMMASIEADKTAAEKLLEIELLPYQESENEDEDINVDVCSY